LVKVSNIGIVEAYIQREKNF